MKHTPGPWRINPDDHAEIETDDEARQTVARVETENCDDLGQIYADAQLIAAAPEVLGALRDALAWIDAVPKETRASLPTMPGFDRDEVDVIVAKAEGGE